MLHGLKALERQAGRRFDGPRDGPRPLDIDLLLAGSTVLSLGAEAPAVGSRSDPGRGAGGLWPGSLVVPHPRLSERRFVLRPLSDLAPELVVPTHGTTVRMLLAALENRDSSQAVTAVPWSLGPP